MFASAPLKIVSEIWGAVEFLDREDHHQGWKLTEAMLTRMHQEGLIPETATKEDVRPLYNEWQIPMYNLDLRLKHVSLAGD